MRWPLISVLRQNVFWVECLDMARTA
jgi:hypothetical protein